MREGVEVRGQVGVDDLRAAVPELAGQIVHGLVGVALGAEAGGARQAIRLEERLAHEARGRLGHPLPTGRDAEGPRPTVRLPEEHPAQRGRPVGPGAERRLECLEELGDPALLYVGEGDPVHSRGAPVRADQGVGMTQAIRPPPLVIEEGQPVRRLLLGLAGALPLEFPDLRWRLEPLGHRPPVPR